MKKKKAKVKNGIAKDLRTPKYKMRVKANKKKKAKKKRVPTSEYIFLQGDTITDITAAAMSISYD